MKQSSKQNRKTSFRIGKVRGDLRGKIWYLTSGTKRLSPVKSRNQLIFENKIG